MLWAYAKVEIFDDGGGRLQQLGVNGRHDCRHRRRQENTGGIRRQHGDHQRRDHLIGDLQVRQYRTAQRASQMHAKHQHRDHHGAEDDPAMHCFAVLVGDAAHRRVRQANHAKAHQDPERCHKRQAEDLFTALR
ncbi:hypothetical protein D3C71_1443920 [compost metagenome]